MKTIIRYLSSVCDSLAIRYYTWLGHELCSECGNGTKFFGRFSIIKPTNVTIGKFVTVNEEVLIVARSNVLIGDNVHLSPRATIITGNLDIGDPPFDRKHLKAPIKIGNNVWLGTGSIILAGVTIGENSIIGAGAVVTRDVPANEIWAGVPATFLKKLSVRNK